MRRLRSSPLLHEVVAKPVLLVWALFILTIPFYVVDSGLPQPGNLLILLLFPYAYRWRRTMTPGLRKTLRMFTWFVIWVCVVNYGWAVLLNKWQLKPMLFPLYYLFNWGVLLVSFVVYQRHGDSFLRITLYCVFIDVLVQVIASFAIGGTGRGSLFFNNPNQLGYYALLAACVIGVAQRRIGLGLIPASVGLTGCGYLALVSASRASVLGIALLGVLLVFSNPRVIIGASLAIVALLAIGGPLASALDSAEQRMDQMQKRNDRSFMSERGYDRLWEYKEYAILGAGEGETSRFNDPWSKTEAHEIHSSAATIVFCYGVVGTCLFVGFMYRIIKRAPLRLMIMLVPTLGYTFAHQGLRFTMMWVTLSVFVAVKTPVVAAPVRRKLASRVRAPGHPEPVPAPT